MYQHFIAITSIYIKGTRIAWHYCAEQLDLEVIQAFTKAFKQAHGSIKLGVHQLRTDSPEWSSVVEKELFFKNVVVTVDYYEFIQQVQADNEIDTHKIMKQFSQQAHL